MNFYSIALKAEATPLIEKFELVKSSDSLFNIYENSDTKLIITGIGAINSSIATTYLLTKYNATSHDSITNIGVCGCSFEANIGDSFFVNKVICYDTNSIELLPKQEDKIYKKLTTFSTAQSDKSIVKNSLIDMEACGFLKSAKKFIDKENITIIKTVSDFVDDSILPSQKIYDLIVTI